MAIARYVELRFAQFTPRRLPGCGGLDARCNLHLSFARSAML
jgi:hypothetical protein